MKTKTDLKTQKANRQARSHNLLRRAGYADGGMVGDPTMTPGSPMPPNPMMAPQPGMAPQPQMKRGGKAKGAKSVARLDKPPRAGARKARADGGASTSIPDLSSETDAMFGKTGSATSPSRSAPKSTIPTPDATDTGKKDKGGGIMDTILQVADPIAHELIGSLKRGGSVKRKARADGGNASDDGISFTGEELDKIESEAKETDKLMKNLPQRFSGDQAIKEGAEAMGKKGPAGWEGTHAFTAARKKYGTGDRRALEAGEALEEHARKQGRRRGGRAD